jgi:hypothetical protein
VGGEAGGGEAGTPDRGWAGVFTLGGSPGGVGDGGAWPARGPGGVDGLLARSPGVTTAGSGPRGAGVGLACGGVGRTAGAGELGGTGDFGDAGSGTCFKVGLAG